MPYDAFGNWYEDAGYNFGSPINHTDAMQTMATNPTYAGPQEGGGMQPYYSTLESLYGIPSGSMAPMSRVESFGNPNAVSPSGTYKGLFQISPSIQDQFGVSSAFDPFQNAVAGAGFAAQNQAWIQKNLGFQPSGFDLYMAHQQGPGGMSELYRNPSVPIGDLRYSGNYLNQRLSGVDGSTPANQFVGIYNTRFNQAPYSQGTWPDYGSGTPYYGQGAGGSGFNGFQGFLPSNQDAFPGSGQLDMFANVPAAFNKAGGTPGPNSLQYNPSTGSYDSSGIWRTDTSNNYGYGGGYNPNAYGWQENYSGGFMGGQNNTGYMNYSGQPDITVYANDPWAGYATGGYSIQPGTAAAQYGGGMTLGDTQMAGQVYDASQAYAQSYADMYQNQLNNQMQTQQMQGQNQFNQNMMNTGTSTYAGGGDIFTQYQPY